MTVTGHLRGQHVTWDGNSWRYDDGTLSAGWGGNERPCPACGLIAEPDGPDPCLGMLPHCETACCGHGVDEGWISCPDLGIRLTVHVENESPDAEEPT